MAHGQEGRARPPWPERGPRAMNGPFDGDEWGRSTTHRTETFMVYEESPVGAQKFIGISRMFFCIFCIIIGISRLILV